MLYIFYNDQEVDANDIRLTWNNADGVVCSGDIANFKESVEADAAKAFIENACKWLKDNCDWYDGFNVYCDGGAEINDRFIERFRNAMANKQ